MGRGQSAYGIQCLPEERATHTQVIAGVLLASVKGSVEGVVDVNRKRRVAFAVVRGPPLP